MITPLCFNPASRLQNYLREDRVMSSFAVRPEENARFLMVGETHVAGVVL